MTVEPGVVTAVDYHPDIRSNLKDQVVWWKSGDRIGNVLTEKAGIAFLEFDSLDEMMDKSERMQSLIKVRVEAK